MERLIHQDLTRLKMTTEEACNLYDAIHYYGKRTTIESAEDMMLSEDPLPLNNHWVSLDDFLNTLDIFCKMSKGLSRMAFAKCVLDNEIPQNIEFGQNQLEVLSRPDEFLRQACFLLSFFDSMSDYFEYEIEMMELGYPHGHRSAG